MREPVSGGGNHQWSVTQAVEKHKSQQILIQELLKEKVKRVWGSSVLGFFSAMFLQLINFPNEGEAFIRSREESTPGEWGRK